MYKIDKKALLAKCLVSGGVLAPLARIRSACRADVPILAYHRVWDLRDENAFPFDLELVSASVAEFRWQMEYVRENFDPITLAGLIDILEGTAPAPPRPIIITFDDGFEDNYENAFPILNALDIPATIFLSTGYIASQATFWYDRLAHLLLSAPERELTAKGLANPVQLGADAKSRRQALRKVLAELKLMPNHRRLEVLGHLEFELERPSDDPPAHESRPLSWDQVREMSNAGIEFGSHTVTHPILANLTDEELEFELVESRRAIELQTGKPVTTISYPVGGRNAFNDRVRQAVQRAGYRLGASYIPGTNPLSSVDPYGLRRQHIERYTERSYFAAMLGMPEVFQ
jgi:peptidoglycan/xylan/chitin deacetylase (PgdA/CDA1 family)